MHILYSKQVVNNDLKHEDIDLFLYALNHEKRGLTSYEYFTSSTNINKSIALCYKGQIQKHNVEKSSVIIIDQQDDIKDIINGEIKLLQNKSSINIFIDYSCMTKPWYYTMLLYFSSKTLPFNYVNIYFSYTPSEFSEPLNPKPNTEIGPLPGKYIVPTNKPKALIVGLGYEQNKAQGIIDHLDPKEFYVLYTDPSLDKRFTKTVITNNHEILSLSKNVVTYAMNDLLSLERELTSLYYLLKDNYSIIIAPLGPKPFTFVAMLLSIKYSDVDIWRVGSGSDINKYERNPIDKSTFIISKLCFTSKQ